MEITSSYQNQGKVLVVDVGTKFDFSKVEDFRNAYGELGADPSRLLMRTWTRGTSFIQYYRA